MAQLGGGEPSFAPPPRASTPTLFTIIFDFWRSLNKSGLATIFEKKILIIIKTIFCKKIIIIFQLRTSMGTERLSNLSRMVAHPDRVKSILNQKIVNKFKEKYPRKLEFNIKGRILYICLILGTAVENAKK